MDSKFTKGEWNIMSTERMGVPYIVYIGGETIFQCYGEEAEANAKLIAAAPELLDFAIQFISAIDNEQIIIQENCDNDGYENNGGRLYELAQKTIKKATE